MSAVVQRNCREQNTRFEPKMKWNVNAGRFLHQSGGNLFVNGGRDEVRFGLLLRELNLEAGITVLLTSSRRTEAALIEAASAGQLNRRLIVCSDGYPNYDPLSGVSRGAGAAFFADVGERLGYRDRSAITGYYAAFTTLFNHVCEKPISLRGLMEFGRHPAAELAQMALEVDENLYEQLQESVAGAKPFRDILLLLDGEFGGFSSDSGLSLITATEGDGPLILCVRPTGNPQLVHALFTAELRCAIGREFHLVLSESQLLNDDGFLLVVEQKKQEAGTVAVLTENAAGYHGAEQLQKNMPRQIILLDGDVNAADLQQSLTALGKYQRFEQTTSSSTPMRLVFSLETSKTSGITQYERPRVLFQEVCGNQAVLFSPKTDLVVAAVLSI